MNNFLSLLNNNYMQLIVLSFLSVCIIKWVLILTYEKTITNIYKCDWLKIVTISKTYYFIFPLLFSVLLSYSKPMSEDFLISLISYFGTMMLIFKVLFKTIIEYVEKKFKP